MTEAAVRDAPARPSRRLATRPREHDRRVPGRPGRPGLRRPGVRRPGVPRWRGRLLHDDTLTRVHGSPDRVDDLTADELERLGVPSLEAGPRGRRRAERSSTSSSRATPDAARSRRSSPVVARVSSDAVVSSFCDADARAGSRPGRRPGRAGSTPVTLARTRSAVPSTWVPRRLDRVARTRSGAVIGRAATQGLEVATWTVRRRPTYRALRAARRRRDLRRGGGPRRLIGRGRRRDAGPTARDAPAGGAGPGLSSRVSSTDRADLVVVGAGTIGGWASTFAARDGAGRVVVVERGIAGQGASSRAAGIVRAQGGTPTTVALGRWSIDFYRRQRRRSGPTAASASSAT